MRTGVHTRSGSRADGRLRWLAERLLVGVLLLRIVVPAGFMPATDGNDWFLKLCPDGMPAAVMTALLGDAHHHHHHGDDANAGLDLQQCDVGAAYAAALATDTTDLLPEAPAHLSDTTTPLLAIVSTRIVAGYLSRAPPPTA